MRVVLRTDYFVTVERPECKGLFVAPAFEFRDNKMFCTCLPGFHLEGNQCVGTFLITLCAHKLQEFCGTGNPCNASGAKTCPAQISECIYVPPDDYRCKCFAGYKETADRRSCEGKAKCRAFSFNNAQFETLFDT